MIRLARHRLVAAVIVLSLAVLAGCDLFNKGQRHELPAQDPVWGNFISAHASGLVSKKSKLRVVFVNDVVTKEQVGQSAAAVVSVDPSVDGTITYSSEREIVVLPAADLVPGRYYKVTVKPKGLLGIPEGVGKYQFQVQVLEQEFQVDVAGLTATPSNDQEMILKGSLATADVDEPERIEKILSATFLDKPVPLQWQHNADGKHHDFSVAGLQRQADRQMVHLAWNGEAIGARTRGEREVEVPARGQFGVTSVQALREDQQYIRVYFSDNLDARQNLRGLVQLGTAGFTARVDGNTLKIYPEHGTQGDVVVTLDAGIRNAKGERLGKQVQQTVTFVSEKPQVRFAGKGVILPENPVLSIPFEAVNVRAVHVTAFRIYENNVGQFLQSNKLDGQNDLGRVGRYLWRRTVHLSAPEANKWTRYSLDATKLLKDNPGGLFRLTLSITPADSTYNCGAKASSAPAELDVPPESDDDLNNRESSGWDFAQDYFGENPDSSNFSDREDPCKSAYYRFADGTHDARNFLASNIGLLAKRDQQGKVMVVATDLRTAQPLKGVKVSLMNFQNQVLGALSTDGDGRGDLVSKVPPFYLLADKDGQKGYLKMSPGNALPVSHFDVGGEQVKAGIKGEIYGERGVWRPGDDIFLTFVLQDKTHSIPANHPVSMELYNPKGQLIQTLVNSTPLDGFYTFTLKTAEDAPTGDWTAKARLGGTEFSKNLKIETVMPNRLKVELDFGKPVLRQSEMPLRGKLFSQWLSGATAAGLKADIKVRLSTVPTRFDRYADFVFDDPAREFSGDPETVFEGLLDATGHASFAKDIGPGKDAPGMLSASFTTRVFENGGAFSTSRSSVPYSPYDNYVGIKLPKGDATRNMLLTDTDHTVEIASLDADGNPVSLKDVQLTLYKVEWKWWWDKSGDSLAQYASASSSSVVAQGSAGTKNGHGTWKFQVKYPEWGRYLLRACDSDGNHCSGKVFYIDWPGWAGRAQEQSGPGASVLTFVSDKPEYNVGETAMVQLPEATQGRALVSVENGTGVLQQRWIEFDKGKARFELPVTKDMTPNVYVSVTLVQPHADKKNDRPIRLYGVIPIKVNDPQTHLKPQLGAPQEWAPESTAAVEVSEANGREMTYTLAVVDEGLLGLTNFKTPNLHDRFFKREALGVTTWDLFDDVADAYGGELERLLALGGSDADQLDEQKEDKKRFPPVVRFLGPFHLKAGAKARHEFKLPQYVGAVRVMLVAGYDGAYGLADKSVFVRQPLMLLPTLPRVVGPDEDLTVPVSLFVMDPAIKDVRLKIEPDAHFQVVGSDSVNVAFAKPDEKLGLLKLKVRSTLGKGVLRFSAVGGQHQAKAEVAIEVRSANPATVKTYRQVIKAGETWEAQVVPHGIAGTNSVALEMSAVPPLNLERRLDYLIRYPHGCVEQVTSSVFPQLYLPQLVKLEDTRKQEVEKNIQAGVDRLRGFQIPTGAFVYWPGGVWNAGGFDAHNAWATNYVGHFLLEAERVGYHVPASMLADWARYQKSAAQSWTAGSGTPVLDQAYRLYTLALAKQPELGAMNRLRETSNLPSVARWQLAAAYRLAGLGDAASDLIKGDRMEIADYREPGYTYGSRLRDTAIVLNSALVLERKEPLKDLVDQVSGELASDNWQSTQSVAYALLAMSRFVGAGDAGAFSFERAVGAGTPQAVKSGAPIATGVLKDFPLAGATVKVKNTSGRTLFGSIVARGVSRAGEETASSSGLAIDVSYTDADGNAVDVAHLRQGGDLVAHVSVTNNTPQSLDNLALTQILPSGWEIHNMRLDANPAEARAALDYQDIRDDRIYRYFGLKAGETKRFSTLLNAAYLGRYYLPSVSVEAMYDASKEARTKGQWVEVTNTGK